MAILSEPEKVAIAIYAAYCYEGNRPFAMTGYASIAYPGWQLVIISCDSPIKSAIEAYQFWFYDNDYTKADMLMIGYTAPDTTVPSASRYSVSVGKIAIRFTKKPE